MVPLLIMATSLVSKINTSVAFLKGWVNSFLAFMGQLYLGFYIIPKANGKMRKLGILCVRDKIVQEVIHMILEAIYDSVHGPYFQETSHGLRPNRSCHT